MGSGEGSTMRNFIVCIVCIVRVIKSKRLRWGGYVARMEESRSAFRISAGKVTGKRLYEGLGVDGRTILEWTLKK